MNEMKRTANFGDNRPIYLQISGWICEKILRGEWVFKVFVTSVWYTHAPQYTEIAAGNDVKMGCGDPAHVLQMMREGRLKREDVVVSVRRLLEMILKLA